MKIRKLLTLAGFVGLLVVAWLNYKDFKGFGVLVRQFRWYILVAVVMTQIFSYYLNALYYRSILRIFGYQINPYRLFEGALAANFVNYLAPTVGLAGAGFLSQVLKPEVPRGEGVFVQITRYALSSAVVLVMIPVGIALILMDGYNGVKLYRIALFSSLIIIFVGSVIIGFVHQETILRKIAISSCRRLARKFHKINPATFQKFVAQFYDGYHRLLRAGVELLRPLGWSFLYIIIEILTLYLSFLLFGRWVNPGIVIMGYLMANIASTLGGTFISTGVFEVGMFGTFVALGLSPSLSVSVTVVYRVLNLLIGLPPGYVFYHRYLMKR